MAAVAATGTTSMADHVHAADQAVADPDPWPGFCRYLQRACPTCAKDRWFTGVLTRSFPPDMPVEGDRNHAMGAFCLRIQRSRTTAWGRGDVRALTLPTRLVANVSVGRVPPRRHSHYPPALSRRFVDQMLQ
jgi:hypothetical protein